MDGQLLAKAQNESEVGSGLDWDGPGRSGDDDGVSSLGKMEGLVCVPCSGNAG